MKQYSMLMVLVLAAALTGCEPQLACYTLEKENYTLQKDKEVALAEAQSWEKKYQAEIESERNGAKDRWDVYDFEECYEDALISDALWAATQKEPLTLTTLQRVIHAQMKDCRKDHGAAASASSSSSASASSSSSGSAP